MGWGWDRNKECNLKKNPLKSVRSNGNADGRKAAGEKQKINQQNQEAEQIQEEQWEHPGLSLILPKY